MNSTKNIGALKIGVILPLTGDAAIYGQAMKNGIQLAYDESPIKNRIELVFEDDMGQNTKASSAIASLLTKNVSVVIGGAQSKTADVIIPVISKNHIPLVSPGASSVDFDSVSEWFFRLWPSDSFDGKIIADYVYNQNVNEGIAVFYTNSKYGVGVKNVFERRIKENKGNILFSEPFSEGMKDFRTQLVKIKQSGAKSLFLPGYFEEVSIIIKQIRELGIDIRIYGTSSFHDEKLIESLKNSLNGVIFSYPDFNLEEENTTTISFSKSYFNKYHVKADVFAVNSFDCFKVIEYVAMHGVTDSKSIRNELSKIQNFHGAGGIFSFDNHGSVIKPFSIYKIESGKYVLLKKNIL